MIKFKNGSYIKIIDDSGNKKSKTKEVDMSDIDWFCDLMGFQLFTYQKVFMWLKYHKEIRMARRVIEKLMEIK